MIGNALLFILKLPWYLVHWVIYGQLPGEKKESDHFYGSGKWRKLRTATMSANISKYGRLTCEVCKTTTPGVGGWHVHHIQPRSKRPDLELDPDNTAVACAPCNMGMSADYSSLDLRPYPKADKRKAAAS